MFSCYLSDKNIIHLNQKMTPKFMNINELITIYNPFK